MLDNLRKKQLLAQLNSHANTNGALDPKEKDATTVTSGMFNGEILAGMAARRDYANSTGKKVDDVISEEMKDNNGTDPVYDSKYGDEYGENPTRAGSLKMVRKPMYDALIQDDEDEKDKALKNLYKKGK